MNCIIQARMTSKRLPGKTLMKINNKYILEILIAKLKKVKNINEIVIATSNNRKDNQIVNFCKKKKIKYFRGSLQDVFSRLLECAKKFRFKYFIRMCADSPFIDGKVVTKLIKISKNKKNYDLYTNVFPRSFPKGQSVEIIRTNIMKNLNVKINKSEKEHVTKYFYKNKKNYKIFNIKNKKNFSKFSLSIDNKKNLNEFRKIFFNYNVDKYFSFKKLIKLKYETKKN